MLKKYLILMLFFCALTLPCLFGATVSCLVIEAGPQQRGSKSQYSTLWENTLMDVLFETGHIVSNGRMIHLDIKPAESFPEAAEKDFQEARTNRMDYFLIAIIEQNSGGGQTVSLRLFSTNSQKLIKEQVYTDNSSKSQREETENIKKAIGFITTQLN